MYQWDGMYQWDDVDTGTNFDVDEVTSEAGPIIWTELR